jgi:serine/threonine-protein kinase
MAAVSTPALVDALRRSPLLTSTQQGELVQSLQGQFPDARLLARQLLARGWLTSYQINQLFQGRGSDLVLGPYVLRERLGEGGTGRVFTARHQHMNRIVAVKIIRPELVSDAEVVARFRREVQVVSQLTHPNIVHAYDAGPAGNSYFLVTEYVVGTDLDRLVKQKGRLSVEQACDYLRQALLGLQHIHEQALVHRDIKPSNLLVTEAHGSQAGGVLKILDLGLARLQRPVEGELTGKVTGAVVTLGTLDYMAPEQALDFHGVDIRGDIYSLGCTFYYVLTGQPPFASGTVTQKLMRHQQAQAQPIEQLRGDVPAALSAALKRMMAKRPDERFATPLEAFQALPATAPVATLVPASTSTLVSSVTVPNALVLAAPAALPLAAPARRSLALWPRRLVRLPRWPQRPVRRRRALALAGTALVALVFAAWLAIRPWGAAADARSGTATSLTEGKYVFLSDLQEIKPKVHWQAKFGKAGDLGSNNRRIMLKGVPSPKGLGMVPPERDAASVSYRLDKQFRAFKVTAALNDSVPACASPMRFVVMGDGRTLWQSNPIQKTGEQQECEVNVSGVDVLELVVTCPGENGNCHAVWIEPQLTR